MRVLSLGLAALMGMSATAADKQSAKSQAELRTEVLRKTGGFVVAPATGRGIKIVDQKSGIPKDVFKSFVSAASTGPRFAVEEVEGDAGKAYMPDDKTGGVIIVKDDPTSPLTILIAPEQAWASVNVAPLKSDSPDDSLLAQRVKKEMWRALVYMLGGGNNQMPACVMKPCASNKDIDDLKMEQPCPEPFRAMTESAKKLGIAQAKLTSYRKACVEGWAPQPANEFQKAIWDEVHAMPTEPIKIKPETSKQK